LVDDLPQPIPERSVLLHIGAPKTGTTALQEAAAARRDELREHGVLYPGTRINHRDPAASLLGHPLPGSGGRKTPPRIGQRMIAELEREPWSRALVSAERFALGKHREVERTLDALGALDADVHVLLCLRNMYSYSLSMWQQRVKNGERRSIGEWMDEATSDGYSLRLPKSGLFPEGDGYTLVSRWASLVGPERMTLLVVDPREPTAIFRTAEAMLALPSGMLGTGSANRSLTATEVEFVRAVAGEIPEDAAADPGTLRALMLNGVSGGIVRGRGQVTGEGRTAFPASAIAGVEGATARLVASVEESGIRVVGSLDTLSARPSSVSEGDDGSAETVPQELATAALEGLFVQASKRERRARRQQAARATTTGGDQAESPAPRSRRTLGRVRDLLQRRRAPAVTGATLLHVSLGTGADQALSAAAARGRGTLAAQGVCVPGAGETHDDAIRALIGDDTFDAWGEVRDEIAAAEPRSTLLSSEVAARLTDAQARAAAAALGPDTRVLLGVDHPGAMAIGRWQRHVVEGGTTSLDDFVREDLGTSLAAPTLLGMVDRWCRTVGPDRVTVVVGADDGGARLVAEAARLLGLDDADAGSAALHAAPWARALSLDEVELIRALNARLAADPDADAGLRRTLVRDGAVRHALESRAPATSERALGLPAWAESHAAESARALADGIRRGGARMVGDADAILRDIPPSERGEDGEDAPSIPADLGIDLVAGMLTTALGLDSEERSRVSPA